MQNAPTTLEHTQTVIFAHKMFQRIGQRILGNAYADDVAQETSLRLLQHGHKLKTAGEVGPFGSRIATNLSLDTIRRNKRFAAGGLDSVQQQHNPARTKEADPVRKELCRKALSCLKPRELTINSLYYWEGCTTAEIGRQLGMTEGHVQVVLHRSRAKMRALVAR